MGKLEWVSGRERGGVSLFMYKERRGREKKMKIKKIKKRVLHGGKRRR